jgi:superfamily II DNA/RNA helicase
MSYNPTNRRAYSSRNNGSRPRTSSRSGGGGRGKGNRQSINPSRYVKPANPSQSGDYESQHTFAEFALHPLIKNNIAIRGYRSPSEIQDKTIQPALEGRDIVGVANTGTGKTAAFALPVLNKLMHNRNAQALVMAPTRELAIQIEQECMSFAKNSGLKLCLLIGGLPMGRQISMLRNNPSIIIGTPGRIKDHVKQGNLNLRNTGMVVLDEVDRMLDMGFIIDMRYLLDLLPEDRQSFFFSATMSAEVSRLIDTFTKDPLTVDVKAGETSDNVHQNIVAYDNKPQRAEKLHDILIRPEVKKTLIFVETKYGVERLADDLKARGFGIDALHGGKSQGQRKRAMESFRDNRVNVLVATDVAARGLDVTDITHVINFDEPNTYDDYVHRIGRAGRAGRVGHALTFVQMATQSY